MLQFITKRANAKNVFKNRRILWNHYRYKSWFPDIKMAPPDAILGITGAFIKDKNPKKVNLGVGAYRDDNTKPWVLPSVMEAENRIFSQCMNKEYTTIIGMKEFYSKAIELALGHDSEIIKEKRCTSAQCLGGTGALRVGGAFLGLFWRGDRTVNISQPNWPNHRSIFMHSGFKVATYNYYDPKTIALNAQGIFDALNKMPEKSIVLLHVCAHNPTGLDPTKEQWCEISNIMKSRKLYPFFDMAYQGFASGDMDRDALAVRIFAEEGHQFCLAQSFSKNMGLYGERVGALSIICSSADEAKRIESNVKTVIRPMYSNPPVHGARIAVEIFKDPELFKCWLKDLKTMANRTIDMRKQLQEKLVELGSKHSWDHITKQIGMFCYTGLKAEQVARLTSEFSIYLTKDGRIAMVGVTSKNVAYVAESIHAVTK